jgi:hypothetical protein
MSPFGLGAMREALRDPVEQAPSVDRLALHGQRAPVDASQHKQIVGQPREALRL